jgi:hypothetical protein
MWTRSGRGAAVGKRRTPAQIAAGFRKKWDGEVRGFSRDDLHEQGYELDDVTWFARQLALQSHRYFMELVWKTPDGKRVKNSAIHNAIGDFLDDAERLGIPALVMAPMGCGKTETGIGWALRKIAKDPTARGGIVTDKDDHSAQRVDLVRRYIKEDKDFRRLFPEIKVGGGKDAALGFRLTHSKTTKDESIEGSGVLASGTGTRKDWIIFDDCVTAKNAIHEPGQRERVIVGYEQTWIGRLVPGSWHYCVCTIYHAADLWHRLMDKVDEDDRPVYAYLKIGVADDFECYEVEERWPDETSHYELPLWEEVWDADAYKKKKANLVFEGDAAAWYTGYKNEVLDPEAATFKEHWFINRYHVQPRSHYPYVCLYADPASSDDPGADNFAGWVVGWDNFHKAGVVLDGFYIRRKSLSHRVETFIDYGERWEVNCWAVEGKHELSFAQRIEERMVERGITGRLVKVSHARQKEGRIAGIAPLLQHRKILVDGQKFPWLWREAMLFPKARFDDGLDALEGAWDRIRRWLKRKGMLGQPFDINDQYTDTASREVPGGHGDRMVPTVDRVKRGEPLDNLLFPGW